MIIRLLERAEEGIISLLLVAVTLLVFFETILRFGFGMALGWTAEGSLTLAGWFVLFGASHGIKSGTHIGVDLLTRTLPPGPKRLMAVVAVSASLVYALLFVYGSWGYLAKVWMINLPMEDLPMPTWLAQSVLLIGFLLITLRIVELLWRVLRGDADGFAFADEARESEHLVESRSDGTDEDTRR